MPYYQADNPGIKDWITHEDNEISQISQYPPNIYITENIEWANKVGATELTKEEAQIVCDIFITEMRIQWQDCMNTEPDPTHCGNEPNYFILP